MGKMAKTARFNYRSGVSRNSPIKIVTAEVIKETVATVTVRFAPKALSDTSVSYTKTFSKKTTYEVGVPVLLRRFTLTHLEY
jgi:hypothetical protein